MIFDEYYAGVALVCLLGFIYGFKPEFLRVFGSWWSDGLSL